MVSFKRFDYYSKTLDTITVRTKLGGAFTVVAALVVGLLLVWDVHEFLRVDLVHRMVVDSAAQRDVVAIKFDIEFPSIPCAVIDFVHETNSPREVLKFKKKYATNSIVLNTGRVGCRARGTVYSESVPGYLKFDFQSEDITDKSHYINYLLFGPAGTILATMDQVENDDFQDHFIDEEVAMSEEAPEYITNELHSPLCNQTTAMAADDGIHQYHVQIVPTRYQDASGKSSRRKTGNMGGINTKPGRRIHSQYSTYERHLKAADVRDAMAFNGHQVRRFSGALFTYDFYPVTVVVEERSEGFSAFLVDLAALLGGTLTVLGLLNIGLQSSAKSIMGKKD